jgi:type II secretory pathway component PulM
MSASEKYVFAAYLVVLAVVLVYVVLYSFKLSRLERAVSELTELAQRRKAA